MKFVMTDKQLETILDACRPVPCMLIGSYVPRTPQENANAAWKALGLEMGFDWETVQPGRDQKTFSADPLLG